MTVLLLFTSHHSTYSGFSYSIRVLLAVVVPVMGCGGSKVDHLPIVTLCRERKDLLKAASEGRYALAVAHLSYFRSLNDVGEALCRFVDEELLMTSSSSSSSGSPALTLPSDGGKEIGPKKKKRRKRKKVQVGSRSGGRGSNKTSSSSTSLSHSASTENSRHRHHRHRRTGIEVIEEEDDEDEDKGKKGDDAHCCSDTDSDVSSSSSGHVQIEDSPVMEKQKPYIPRPGISYSPTPETYNSNPYYPNPLYTDNSDGPYSSFSGSVYPPHSYTTSPQDPYSSYGYSINPQYPSNSYPHAYYMKKLSPAIPSIIYEEPKQNPIHSYSGYPGYLNNTSNANAGYFGFMMNSGSPAAVGGSNRRQSQQPPPPTPPSPKASTWDYLNLFETYDNNVYASYYPPGRYGYGTYGSDSSSPDSTEVRAREGIPELEEETESEVTMKETYGKQKKVDEDFNNFGMNNKNKNAHFEEASGDNFGEGTSKAVPLQRRKAASPRVEVKEVKSSNPESNDSISSLSKSSDEVCVKKKEVSFEVDGASLHDIGSSKVSSSTTLSAPAHGTRDLREVVREIKSEFKVASDYGKEVSLLLEVGRPPYRSRGTFFRVILARLLYSIAPPTSSYPPATFSASLHHSIGKTTRAYAGDSGNGTNSQSLASTLEKLYVWEKKLYNEVKDEERLRIAYEKQCKKLKALDEQGAENRKIEAAEVAIRKLLTKLDVSIRAVHAISNRIHKLRDEELHPQLRELICGLRRMWKAILKCHQKQFRAILESKMRILRAHAFSRKESSVKATFELEMELQNWCGRFLEWVGRQRSCAETLNGWLLRCLSHETEESVDGPVPFSPGHIGAPPTFVVCHDWKQAMERVSESVVETAMHDFSTSLHHVLERQDVELYRKLKVEYLKQSNKQGRAHHVVWARMQHEQDALSDKTTMSMIPSESGISPLDDLKVDLDSIKQRSGRKEGGRASRTIQAGLIPIFEALESFSSEALKAYKDVRVEGACGDS